MEERGATNKDFYKTILYPTGEILFWSKKSSDPIRSMFVHQLILPQQAEGYFFLNQFSVH